MYSKYTWIAERLLEVCWTFARSCKHPITVCLWWLVLYRQRVRRCKLQTVSACLYSRRHRSVIQALRPRRRQPAAASECPLHVDRDRCPGRACPGAVSPSRWRQLPAGWTLGVDRAPRWSFQPASVINVAQRRCSESQLGHDLWAPSYPTIYHHRHHLHRRLKPALLSTTWSPIFRRLWTDFKVDMAVCKHCLTSWRLLISSLR